LSVNSPAPSVSVFAPASVSNVGPGFDVLGFCLHRPGDRLDAEWSEIPGIEIAEITGDAGHLSLDASRNAAGVAAAHVLKRALEAAARGGGRSAGHAGLRIRLHKQMPLSSGLGSSGASSAAGAVAANELLGRPFSREELVASAMEGERAACGSPHADNVAPSILGGFVLVRSYAPLEIIRLPVPDGLFVAVVHPRCEVSTSEARRLLADRRFPIGDIVANSGNLAALVTALHRGDLALLGRCIEDRLVEPVRAALVPGYASVRRAAIDGGALGCSLSGSGPSVFAFADSEDVAARVALSMRRAFTREAGIGSEAYVGAINTEGAQVLGVAGQRTS
jgi:homoserine kinase